MDTQSQLTWIGALVGLIGLWLIIGPPFLFEAPFADFWSDLIVGFVLLSLAVYTYARRESAPSQWAMGAAAIFGGWVIVGAFLWGTNTILFWNDVLAGGIVAVLAGYSAYEARETHASNGRSDDDSGDG
jgi:peptidoglycan/LPS O-acetylase OafA/YrhL